MIRRRWVSIALTALVTVFTASALGIVIDGLHDDVGPADVGIVPGSMANPDGTPSHRLAARLDKAVALYRAGLIRHVIVSGGTGKEGVDEAVVMQRYLQARQLPLAVILVDHQGNTTNDTARNAARLMQINGFQSATIVTQYFHVTRMRVALKKYWAGPIYHAHSTFFELRDFYAIVREVPGLLAYVLR